MEDKYWTRVDEFNSTYSSERTSLDGIIYTYEHKVPGGRLILTEHRWNGRLAATVVFVADAIPSESVPETYTLKKGNPTDIKGL